MKLPKYAQGVSSSLLVRYTCKGRCQSGAYGKVSLPDWETADKSTNDVYVVCLKCGVRATDHYNWARV
jgi:hypothetical protein